MEPMVVLIGVFAIFIPALMLPGPDFVAVVRSSMTGGASAGLLTAFGVSIGLAVYASLSLLGLSAILAEYQYLAWTIRILGGSYLVYLGLRLLFTKSARIDIGAENDGPRGNSLIFGILVTLTNPKAIVLFASVFATAVAGQNPVWLMVVMIALVFGCSLTWYSGVSLFMSSKPVMNRFKTMQHWIERLAGVCFVAIGGRILADGRNPVTP
jgi:threonine/homoserine/homoserine lactone efflux protein